ncbi:MAG: ABC transporter permease [Gammaproteobacteria bacterium]|nr:ABC transporter permease [Gammaproteobacteria bacterium]
MPQFVVLWTDALILLLVVLALGFARYAAGRPHLRGPWRRVVRSRVGMGTLVVLGFYLVVGLLDSVHFYPPASDDDISGQSAPGEVMSLFDSLVPELRMRRETTYSAPLATHLYAKETIELGDGTATRGFARLKFGGAHLTDPAVEKTGDLIRLSLSGLLKGVAFSLVVGNLILMFLAVRAGNSFGTQAKHVLSGRTEVPWRVVLSTLGLMFVLIFWSAELASKYHLLGTDKVGEDVFYQSLKSIRTGLVIGTLTTLVMLPVAVLLGIMAGYFRGWVDDVIQYVYTTLNSIPGVLLIAAAILMLQIYMSNHENEFNSLVERADLRLLFLCIILGITSWTGLCRLLRGEALKLREMEYVQAATAFGVGHLRIIVRHILPNVLHIVLIAVVLDFSGLVLAEAVLSYVNIGVDPTMDSWGNMINSARLEMAREPVVWWSLAAAMLFMFTLVLCANLFSDVVRDAFDPRLRDSR